MNTEELSKAMYEWSKQVRIEDIIPQLNPEAVGYYTVMEKTWTDVPTKPETLSDLMGLFAMCLTSAYCTKKLEGQINFVVASLTQYYHEHSKV